MISSESDKIMRFSKRQTIPKANRNELEPISLDENGCWPRVGQIIKVTNRVQFAESPPQVREYTADTHEGVDIIIPLVIPLQRQPLQQDIGCSENNPVDTIISVITEWDTKWIEYEHVIPPKNGLNSVLENMTDTYSSFISYKG